MTKNMVFTMVIGAAGVFAAVSAAASGSGERVRQGEHLVKALGCADCHTPLKLTERGPEPDLERSLSGHPEGLQMPGAPALPPGPWVVVVSGTNTAWAGPWGTSFTSNLTPDPETGLGRWTEREFIATVRTGRHLGRGRPVLPPMPLPSLRTLTDQDLGAIFAYLRSVKPVKNGVPEPRPPAAAN
jgi:mono/diheme cytochrome c family protein